jgi:hypothetical protein
VGNVGRQAGHVSYVLYNPGNDQVSFKRVPSTVAQGFGVRRAR